MILNIRMLDGRVVDINQTYDERFYTTLFVPDGSFPLNDRPTNYRWNGSTFVRAATEEMRSAAKVELKSSADVLIRALVSVMIDEFNRHALKINSILDAADAATSLADFKTRMAAITDYPPRTMAQLIDAIKAAIDAGAGD